MSLNATDDNRSRNLVKMTHFHVMSCHVMSCHVWCEKRIDLFCHVVLTCPVLPPGTPGISWCAPEVSHPADLAVPPSGRGMSQQPVEACMGECVN
jgi:hypothetical protein